MVWRKPAASRGYGGCRSARVCRQLSQRSVATKWIAATPPSWRCGANRRMASCDRVCTGCRKDPSGIGRQYPGEKSSGAGTGSCAGTASAAGPSVFTLLGRARRAAKGREGCRIPASRPFALFQAHHPGQQRLRRLIRRTERRRATSFCPRPWPMKPGKTRKIAPHNARILREGAAFCRSEATTGPGHAGACLAFASRGWPEQARP